MIAETSRMDGAKRRLSQLGKNAATTVISTALVISSAVAAPQSNAQEAYAPESREWGDSVPLPPGADIVVNPPLKASEYSCTPEVGRSIALVFDLSTSIGVDGLQQTKAAGKAVVETLDGTRNKVGIYNFGTVAPAADAVDAQSDALSMEDPSSKDTLNGAIDRMTVGHRAATNWDRGLAQLQGKNYDVVYFVTDGLPTVYADAAAEARKRENGAKYDWYGNLRSYPRGALNNPGYSHLDSNGRAIKDYAAALADVQRAVASANNLKTEGTRIVPLAVGDAVNDGNAARAYLNYISGDGDWVPVTHFSELAEDLSKQATGDCQGELVINKQLTNSKGAIVDGELADFQFEAVATANGISVLNGGNATTNAGGSATLRYLVTDKRIPTTLSITETNGDLKDVKCTAQSGGQVPSDVIKREGNTFSVPTGVGEKVTCTVINRAPCPVCNPVTETVTTTKTLPPSTVTTTETPEPVTETVTETPEPVTTTEIPEPVTETVTETPATVTVTAKTKPGSSLRGGSSEGDIDERCLPATLALAVPLLALVPMQLMQGMSLPLVDDIAGQINEQIASANRQVQDGLGIYDERTAQAIENFNAQIRQHQTDNAAAFQAAGTVAVIAALAGYFAYFCVPRSDEAKSSLLDSSSRSA